MEIEVTAAPLRGHLEYRPRTLLDTGCTSSSIDKFYVRKNRIPTLQYDKPITIWNADRSINGYCREYVEMAIQITDHKGTDHWETIRLQVINLGRRHDIFLGWDWHEYHNPSINFQE
jgi:hypothetical protein